MCSFQGWVKFGGQSPPPFINPSLCVCVCVCSWACSVAQSCLTLCKSKECSLSGFSVHGIFQAGILEQVVISYSRGSSWFRDQTRISYIYLHCQMDSLPLAPPEMPTQFKFIRLYKLSLPPYKIRFTATRGQWCSGNAPPVKRKTN